MELFDYLIDRKTSFYSSAIVIIAVSCSVSEIKRYIGRKRQFFILSYHLTCTITYNRPLEFLSKILIQTVGVPKLKNIAEKFNLVCKVHQRHRQTDDRQTDLRRKWST